MSKASKALVATKGKDKPAAKAVKGKERAPMKDVRAKLRSSAAESSALPWEDEKPTQELNKAKEVLTEKQAVLYDTLKGMGYKPSEEVKAKPGETAATPHPLLGSDTTFTNHPVYQQAEKARLQREQMATHKAAPLPTKQAVFGSASGPMDSVHYQNSVYTAPSKPKKVSTATFGGMGTSLL